jgi:predicted glycosyltransferase involved in capsule biosynthesis
MLSILIPIYNQDVRSLVHTLAKQCVREKINYQILCFDDGSSEKYRAINRELGFIIHVNYTEMSENLGRSKIRNWLGKAAYFEYLLFLDGDSVVKSRNFIKTYVEQARPDLVLYGGRTYSKKMPAAKKKRLHWKYGNTREALPANKRNKDAYLNFQSNNFLIPQQIFNKKEFDESVTGYGYEDLLYARELQQLNVPIKHIDNPVIHEGLENNNVFMQKTENAIRNLAFMYKKGSHPPTRLVKTYEKLERFGITDRVYNFMSGREKRIKDNLLSENPSVSMFNFWKLILFIGLVKTK